VKRRLTIPPLGKPAGLRPRPRFTTRCIAECGAATLGLLLAAGSAIDVLCSGLEAESGWLPLPGVPAIAVLPVTLLVVILIGKRIRRQMSVRFDGFGIHFRRRLEARAVPWRTVTKVTAMSRWHGDSIRIESETTSLTVAGGYYDSADTVLEFLKSQVRFHARIEAKLKANRRNL